MAQKCRHYDLGEPTHSAAAPQPLKGADRRNIKFKINHTRSAVSIGRTFLFAKARQARSPKDSPRDLQAG